MPEHRYLDAMIHALSSASQDATTNIVAMHTTMAAAMHTTVWCGDSSSPAYTETALLLLLQTACDTLHMLTDDNISACSK
jgi:hypothetical protein